MTTSALKIVGWNAAAVCGVALTSSAVTAAINKSVHYSFEVSEDLHKTSSAAIRFFAFIAGTAAGLYALQKSTIVLMDYDANFISAHALPVLASIYCLAMGYLVSFGTDKRTTTMYVGFAGVLISIPCAARFGAHALLHPIGIGAALGSYL